MGEVWCWGDNSANALGTASEEDPIYVASPVLHWETYQPLSGMKAVTTMQNATCAISADEDASIFCWGADNYGQMGNDGLPAYDFAAPTGAMTHPDMLTAWDTHYCGLKAGIAACWGSNSSGQTGLGSTSGTEQAPTTLDGLPALRSVHAIFNGTCFITEDYAVACAGANSSDRFGQGIYYSADYLDVPGLDEAIPE
jgi:alpha-tubulin suppressor-like RCC1 family protein